MKNLIIFMSKHGTTAEIASTLKSEIGIDDTKLVNLGNEEAPSLNQYSTVIVGASIHVGKIQSKIKAFLEAHSKELLSKKLGLFMCCMNKEKAREEFNDNFPPDLVKHATATGLFGGELLLEKMSWIDKAITKKVSGVKESVHAIDKEAIHDFVRAIK